MKITALILCAGNSSRMKIDKSKLLLEINNKTVIERTVSVFDEIDGVDNIIIAARKCDIDTFKKILSSAKTPINYVIGGDSRQSSVTNAVNSINNCDLLIIHDGARPLITKNIVNSTIEAAKKTGAAATGVPVKDTIKQINDNNEIVATPNRNYLYSIQTPQIFNFKLYKSALEKANDDKLDLTDDCQIIERTGKTVSVVCGEYSNIKITTAEDVPLAKEILKQRGEN